MDETEKQPQPAPSPAPEGEAPAAAPNPADPTPLSLQRLRTYRDDIEVAVRAQNLSVAKVFLAEEERRRRAEAAAEVSAPDSPRNRLYIALAIFLVLLGIGAFGYFRFFHQQPPVGDLRIDLPSFVRSDETNLIDATGRSVRDLGGAIAAAARAPLAERSVREVVVAKERATEDPDEETLYARVPAGELLEALGATLPPQLARGITPEYFLGSYGARGRVDPFIIVTVEDHAAALAGMLEWEETIARDLSSIFPAAWTYVSTEPRPSPEAPRFRFGTSTAATSTAATSTAASSTPVLRSTPGSRNTFVDLVISNKDARALQGQGRSLILYSFIEPRTILIADDPLMVSEVTRRLSVDRQLH